ncbi:IMG2 [Candida theae]|uniref:Large ribosomal subunit protein mL49 n=1 Tax=Candida theae TaxID=1198502 RepID=A0AAD5FZ96_9ASCO|nr:IMG2 [Candida theae]KAI5959335.1 IMG2 [Candida theae]
MRPTPTALALRVKLPKPELPRYVFQDLSSVSYRDLPNNGFGINNYYITKTKFHHWPVYKKIQNTKITTEIKRIQGDLHKLKQDLLDAYPHFEINMNQSAGILNIKGDVTKEVNELFDRQIHL